MQKLTKETLKKVKVKLAYSDRCDILSPVSERKNNMKNEMTMTEIRQHFEQRRRLVEELKAKLKADAKRVIPQLPNKGVEGKLKKEIVRLMIQIN